MVQSHTQAQSSFRGRVISCTMLRRQASDPLDAALTAMAAAKVHWTQANCKVVESPFASMGEDTTPDVSLATTTRESSHDEAGVTVLPSSPVRPSAVLTSVSELPPMPYTLHRGQAERGWFDIPTTCRSEWAGTIIVANRMIVANTAGDAGMRRLCVCSPACAGAVSRCCAGDATVPTAEHAVGEPVHPPGGDVAGARSAVRCVTTNLCT